MTVEPLAACGHPQDWTGLYRKDYDLVTPESTAHPAKGSWDLAFRILDHLREMGLLKDGDTVLDPMCGTSRFPIAACSRGLRAIGVELEPRFIAFSEQNREYASRKLGRPLDMTIIQGDSRKLSELLEGRGLVTLMSPPYQDMHLADLTQIKGDTFSQIGRKDSLIAEGYGSTPGQIGAMQDRPLRTITSPPAIDFTPKEFYTELVKVCKESILTSIATIAASNATQEAEPLLADNVSFMCAPERTPKPKKPSIDAEAIQQESIVLNVGRPLSTSLPDANLAKPDNAFQANHFQKSIGPAYSFIIKECRERDIPWRVGLKCLRPFLKDGGLKARLTNDLMAILNGENGVKPSLNGTIIPVNLAETDAEKDIMSILSHIISSRLLDSLNLSLKSQTGLRYAKNAITKQRGIEDTGETYLSEMSKIYQQIALVSDVLVVVTKNPTRNGKLRRLDLSTIALLEATGWAIRCVHRAILFEEHETQNLFGETNKRVKGRMSFFKRLQWQKGKSEIAQWEDVIFAVRDGGRGSLRTVMSPPYEDSNVSREDTWREGESFGGPHSQVRAKPYGQSPGQIGNLKDV